MLWFAWRGRKLSASTGHGTWSDRSGSTRCSGNWKRSEALSPAYYSCGFATGAGTGTRYREYHAGPAGQQPL